MEKGVTPLCGLLGEWRMTGEKQAACGETFSENSPFFTRWGEEVRFSILREWALRHSRRGCHVTILRPPRMGGKRCDNPYYLVQNGNAEMSIATDCALRLIVDTAGYCLIRPKNHLWKKSPTSHTYIGQDHVQSNVGTQKCWNRQHALQYATRLTKGWEGIFLLAVFFIGFGHRNLLQKYPPKVGFLSKPWDLTLHSRESSKDGVHLLFRCILGHFEQHTCNKSHKLPYKVVVLLLDIHKTNYIDMSATP